MAASAAMLLACSKTAPPEEPIRAVRVLTVGVDAFSANHEFAGEVRAKVESRLGFRVGGKIIKRQAELGQHVNAGQVLAQLDPQDYKLAADASRAQLRVAATNRDLAAADYKRYKALKDQNFISGAELERRDATLQAAQAQYEQAQSQLAVQGNQAGYASLVADVAGVVTATEAEPGQVVTAGAPVVRIAADGVRDVVFSVPEDKVVAIKPGMVVAIHGWAQDIQLTGKVREVAASADPVTRTYQVKVSFDGKDTAPPLGATVYAVPQGMGATEGLRVIKLPTSALRRDGKVTAVWVLDKTSMTVKSQTVQIATADGNDAVIASGLKPGMQVVSAGVHVLSEGQKVSIYQEKQAVAAGFNAQTAINSEVNDAAAVKLAASAPAAPAASAPVATK
ncbi:MAG: efflux RND transporter periplasmic adaptor subunit [Chitinophagaceae bacterium]|nr:efflux RND transporter periplasmic adaptor subunit [Polaromonas sp.]